MNKKKYIGHISISIVLIIAFIAITILFSTLFKVTSENLRTQATVELGALQGTKTRTENVGSECTGGTVYCEDNNVNSLGVPSGYLCIENYSMANHQTMYNAPRFREVYGDDIKHSHTEWFRDDKVKVDASSVGVIWDDDGSAYECVLWGGRHFSLADYALENYGYHLGRGERPYHIRSKTYWECTGDHRELSDKMDYIVSDGASEVEKQWAVWRDNNENIGRPEGGTDSLTEASDRYADYAKKIKERKYTKCN